MKKAIYAGLIVLVGALAAQAADVQLTWDYDYSLDPACTSTRISDCVQGFALYRDGVKFADIPNPIGADSSALTGIITTVQVERPYGATDLTLRAVALLADGVSIIESVDSNAVRVVITPRPPQNVR